MSLNENEQIGLIDRYLHGTISKPDADIFYDWLNEDKANKELFFEVKAIFDASKADSFDAEKSWLRLMQKKYSSKKKSFFQMIKRYAAVATIAVIVTSSAFITFIIGFDDTKTYYIDGNGVEANVIVLPDGTKVSLSPYSTISYNRFYGLFKRDVKFEGEAYFEVAKKHRCPFIVNTKDYNITVMGTKFNVMAFSKDSLLVTTLLEGSIYLTNLCNSSTTVVKPNQQFVYNRNSKTSLLQNVNAQESISWITGYYYFDNKGIEDILRRMSQVCGFTFSIKSSSIKDIRFTGTFYKGQSIKDIMEIIKLSTRIKYEIKDNHLIIKPS